MNLSLQLTEDDIARRLAVNATDSVVSEFPPGFLTQELRPAAVLIPMLVKDGEWNILYIRRTANHKDPHSGQVAFPGGAADAGDTSPEANALREAQEEIGVKPAHIHIVGRLVDFVTITSYRVSPVVGIIPWPYPLVLQAGEVSRAFTIPLKWLADPNNHEVRDRPLPAPYEPIRVFYFKPYDGETLWGASARFTLELVHQLLG